MALVSSGQLSLSDIANEQGVSLSNVSLGSMSDTAGFSEPDAVSDFYGYSSYSNTHYASFDGVNDYAGGTWSGQSDLVNKDWSVSCWVRNNETSNTNMVLWDFNAAGFNAGNNNNRVFLTYSQNVNRFVLRVRSNAQNFDRQWALHSNNSATGTGTNSGVKWTSTNRGNVNSDNFCHLVCTYDASQSSPSNAFKIYWNGTELTSQANALSQGRTAFTAANAVIANAVSNTTAAGAAKVDMDEWAFYTDVLTSSEASTLYNSGTIVSPHTLHTDSLSEVVQFGANGDLNTYGSDFSGSVEGGTTGTYA